MLGKDYGSYDEFKKACRSSRTPLAINSVLGKVYSISQLRSLAEWLRIDPEGSIFQSVERQGKGRRYPLADTIAFMGGTERVGEALSRHDHSLYFPFLTYFRLPDSSPYTSLQNLVSYLRRAKDIRFVNSFVINVNGIVNPSGRTCELESMCLNGDNDTFSLLFSCTRILVIPDGQPGSVENYFLARIPVLVRYLFGHRLIEISMPFFSEVPGASDSKTQRAPERYQLLMQNVIGELVQLLPYEPRPISFNRVVLYLETVLGAVDMGWKIEPQQEAAFDLQGLIPLKKVLDNFSESLKDEYRRRGYSAHPLADIDLYRVFRALKDQSYTYLFILDAPIGSRGGSFKIQTLYGQPNSGYAPVFWIPDYCQSVANTFRSAVDESQSAKLENPYDLEIFIQGSLDL
jgi:hypothetical protein